MKTTSGLFRIYALIAGAAMTPPIACASFIAFENPAPSVANPQPAGGPHVLGLDFSVVSPTQIESLGAYDNAQDGIFIQPIRVTIFDLATGYEVVPEVSFSTGDPGALIGGSRFKPIDPVVLAPGRYSVVAAYYYPAYQEPFLGEPIVNLFWGNSSGTPIFNDGSGRPSSGPITYRFDVYDLGPTLEVPTQAISSHAFPDFSAGTFMFTGLLSATGITPVLPEGSTVPDDSCHIPGVLWLTPVLLLRRKGVNVIPDTFRQFGGTAT